MFLSILNNKNMKDTRNAILADNIRAERNRKNLSQVDLAKKIGVSESTISLIERSIQTPSIFIVSDIAVVLGIDINDLLKNIYKNKNIIDFNIRTQLTLAQERINKASNVEEVLNDKIGSEQIA